MTTNTPNIGDILGFLTNLLSRGWLALQACKRLDSANKNNEINCALCFINQYIVFIGFIKLPLCQDKYR